MTIFSSSFARERELIIVDAEISGPVAATEARLVLDDPAVERRAQCHADRSPAQVEEATSIRQLALVAVQAKIVVVDMP
jgi:hypothetical protein